MHWLHLPSKPQSEEENPALKYQACVTSCAEEKLRKEGLSVLSFNSSLIWMSCSTISPTQRTGRDCLCCYTFTKTSFFLVRGALDRMRGFSEKGSYKCIWKGIDVLAVVIKCFFHMPFSPESSGSFQHQSNIFSIHYATLGPVAFWQHTLGWIYNTFGTLCFPPIFRGPPSCNVLQAGDLILDVNLEETAWADSLPASKPVQDVISLHRKKKLATM